MPELDEITKELMKKIEDATRKCWNCNFCISVCPVFSNTGGFYSRGGSGLTQSLYYAVKWGLLDGPDKEELMRNIFRCTTCNACVVRCKSLSAGIPLMEIIGDGRKLLVENSIGPMPDQRKVLESVFMYGNPYGQAAENRLAWIKDLKVKKLPHDKAETVLFIGCSASYEPSLHKVARSLVNILQTLEVDFGILENERCSGDIAIRLGDEVLFQEVSSQNIEALNNTGSKTIVTLSPHDFNVFSQDYQGLKERFEIKHYTVFLSEILEKKHPDFKKEFASIITYHDPCYLSKHHNIVEQPRKILRTVPGVKLVEMKMHGLDNLCCGGGGGRMFTEVEEEKRLSDMRVGQALETGASVVATACPWCHVMLENAVKDLKVEDKLAVMDVAEIFARALGF